MNILGQIIVAIVLAVISYALSPRPKLPRREATQELEAPTASAGKPIPVVFGEVTITEPNCLGYWDINTQIERVKV